MLMHLLYAFTAEVGRCSLNVCAWKLKHTYAKATAEEELCAAEGLFITSPTPQRLRQRREGLQVKVPPVGGG